MKQNKSFVLFSLLFSSLCGGCDPFTFVGAGAAVGTAAGEERGLEGIASDTNIRSKINYLWLTEAPDLIDQVGLSVQNGRVVLTGVVENAHLKAEAVRLTRQIEGVTSVIDEIKVGSPESWSDYMRDTWITTKLKAALLTDERIRSRNYSLRTVDKVIYLMGTAQSQEELDLVIAHAQETPNVRQVVNHVQLKDQVVPLSHPQGHQNMSSQLPQHVSSPPEFNEEAPSHFVPPATHQQGAVRKAPVTPFSSSNP